MEGIGVGVEGTVVSCLGAIGRLVPEHVALVSLEHEGVGVADGGGGGIRSFEVVDV